MNARELTGLNFHRCSITLLRSEVLEHFSHEAIHRGTVEGRFQEILISRRFRHPLFALTPPSQQSRIHQTGRERTDPTGRDKFVPDALSHNGTILQGSAVNPKGISLATAA